MTTINYYATNKGRAKNVRGNIRSIPRGKIPWDPKIDYEKCSTCGKCVDFCHTSSFRLEKKDGEKRTAVNPNRCVVFCRGCEDICPAGAITHPSEEETQKIIDKIKEDKT